MAKKKLYTVSVILINAVEATSKSEAIELAKQIPWTDWETLEDSYEIEMEEKQ